MRNAGSRQVLTREIANLRESDASDEDAKASAETKYGRLHPMIVLSVLASSLLITAGLVGTRWLRDVLQDVEKRGQTPMLDRQHFERLRLLRLYRFGKKAEVMAEEVREEVDEAKVWATQAAGAALTYGRSRHASAYLEYDPARDGSPIKAWYQTLIPKHSADDTYFAVQGTQFGYFGLQQVRKFPYFEGKVVFSMWDRHKGLPTDASADIVECGHHSICTRFTGEGTGAKSYINFHQWMLNHQYAFLTIAHDVGGGKVRYDGYFHAEELGGWVLVSKMRVSVGSQPWHLSHLYSFTEQWSVRDFGKARWQKLGPSYVHYSGAIAGRWQQVRSAEFWYKGIGLENTENINGNVTSYGMQWGLGIGGRVSQGKNPAHLHVKPFPEIPRQLAQFEDLTLKDESPSGCAGHTCFDRWCLSVLREAVSSSHLALTIAISVIFILSICIAASVLCAGFNRGFALGDPSEVQFLQVPPLAPRPHLGIAAAPETPNQRKENKRCNWSFRCGVC